MYPLFVQHCYIAHIWLHRGVHGALTIDSQLHIYYSDIQWFTVLYTYICVQAIMLFIDTMIFRMILSFMHIQQYNYIQLNTMTYNDLHWYTVIQKKHIQSDTRRNWYAMRWVASIQRKPLPGLILHSAFFFIIVIIFNTTIIITINPSFTLLTAILADNYGFK